jgi:hypothetical protein
MFFAYSSAFLILIVLTLLFYNISGDTPPVVLATPIVSNASVSPLPGDTVSGNYKKLEVTTDSVQSVIATMNRQESYTYNITVSSYWSSGKAEYKILAYVRSGKFRLSVSGPKSDPAKNIIINDDNIYIWYEGSKSYYTGNVGSKSDSAILDKYEMIPTYEDVLKLEKWKITKAGFVQYNNEPCIYVRAQSGDFDYIYKYYVSVNTGLLTAAFTYDKDTLIYSMTADAVSLTVPSDDMFKLPDGKSAVSS